jgi:hypothetical protein
MYFCAIYISDVLLLNATDKDNNIVIDEKGNKPFAKNPAKRTK